MAKQDSLDEPAAAFADLIRGCADAAYNFAFRLSGNEQDARDLIQEALMRAFEHRGRYDPAKPFSSWLFKIVQNLYLDGARRYERSHATSLDVPPPSEQGDWDDVLPGTDRNPIDGLLERERDSTVQRALDSLPPLMKCAVALCDIEGLPYDEISRVMDCPLGTVRSRIHQGRILLRERLERIYETGRSPQ